MLVNKSKYNKNVESKQKRMTRPESSRGAKRALVKAWGLGFAFWNAQV